MGKYVGKSINRLDGVQKVTGSATFASDMIAPGMLFGKILRSPHPHARVLKVDASEAEKLPGVKAVIHRGNVPNNPFNTAAPMYLTVPYLKPVLDQQIFSEKVRFVGDEVAAVAAISEKIAAEACRLIKVEYEVLPAVFDIQEALAEDAPEIHDPKITPEGKNIVAEIIRLPPGPPSDDVEKAFEKADVIIEEEFNINIVKQCQMETMAALAVVEPDGKINVISTTQTPHPARAILAKVFGVPASKIRVSNPPFVGGGFGVRIGLSAKAEIMAVALSLAAKKPVKVVYTREEDFLATDTRHGAIVRVKLGAMKDGTFVALDLKGYTNTGAYCTFGAELPGVLGAMTLAIYNIPAIRYYGHSVYTNCTHAGAMRGFGNPQGNFPLERVVDMMAEKLNIDAKDLREKNIMKAGEPWFLPYPCSSSELAECIKRCAESIGWERRGKFKNNSGTIRRGLGMAVGTHVSNAWPFCVDYDNAYVAVQQDGSVNLSVGCCDMGTGTSTCLPQVCAETLGIKFEDLTFTFGDTASTPFTIGNHASRGAYAQGITVKAAAEDARKQILEYAAPLFKVSPGELTIEDSIIKKLTSSGEDVTVVDPATLPGAIEEAQAAPVPPPVDHEMISPVNTTGAQQGISLEGLSYYAHIRNKQFLGIGRTIPFNAPPWHCCAAEVEVDMELGTVQVIKMAAAHDVGTAINPKIVEGQIEGGVVQGIGFALNEEILYKPNGHQAHTSFSAYMLPTAEDIPEIDAIIVAGNDPSGPYGAKGVGECGLVCPASAIANAVADALGAKVNELPMTAERVYELIRKA
ncbi:xanthine dehydrogenase family protein molybdopterin-binding subunit [Desulfomonile tiedjei]|uniref:Aerobic-type carbon monoxide dehydrogenase, large subunit CoxL/CutL-like protein n=1 Tax=Desulfomonile tiedjei (strain ATCC 49306 / DSM 6799 / DCB-1) TaxID=706587 RepID=I4C688_DESTA|nr:molybdopterin cofactor-binding domain-containing protein [Desulfomonile tiedjei]AFM25079.1 aerobic-type carbon monoxide dehydrogenase, large subunit CoxL/CutL-like protein [Desulfomonile tiedjei DSM 6799]